MNDGSPVRAPVVDVRNISMAYKLYKKPADMLKEAIFGGAHHDTFWALRDISLTVHEGERLGIIGPNGAGKSTLLQVIAGNLQPTTGSVSVNGRISSLLSLVPAWNIEETGLDNIKFNLLVQGVEPKTIPALVDDIVDFTDLGPFIHQPVKTYSVGMGARLSFAIATAIKPEILIVDEVLGAGDGYFAGRAARRMQEMCARGKALLFVSHSTGAVRMMCDTCIWIENGQIRLRGPVDTVVRQYEEDVFRQQDETMREGNRRRLEAQRQLVAPEDIDRDRLLRLRIRPERPDPRVTEVHYIRDIRVSIGQKEAEVPLELVDIRKDTVPAALDLHSCEWGRIYERKGALCRALLPRTGVRNGGHALVKLRQHDPSDDLAVRMTFDVASEGAREPLTAEYVDVEAVEWKRLEIVSRKWLGGDWTRIELCGNLPRSDKVAPPPELALAEAEPHAEAAISVLADAAVSPVLPTPESHAETSPESPFSSEADACGTPEAFQPEISASSEAMLSEISPKLAGEAAADDGGDPVRLAAIEKAMARAQQLVRNPVTIADVSLEVAGRRVFSVAELQPFSIKVVLDHHDRVPGVSVNLNILRSDGAYVFYQPSGLDDHNITDFQGRSEVIFHFDPNPFGFGDYEVNVFAANGFSWENIPPSEVFDRSIANLMFKVQLARPIAFGLVNLLVPVTVQLTPTGQADSAGNV